MKFQHVLRKFEKKTHITCRYEGCDYILETKNQATIPFTLKVC